MAPQDREAILVMLQALLLKEDSLIDTVDNYLAAVQQARTAYGLWADDPDNIALLKTVQQATTTVKQRHSKLITFLK